jgi:hypothetical protein
VAHDVWGHKKKKLPRRGRHRERRYWVMRSGAWRFVAGSQQLKKSCAESVKHSGRRDSNAYANQCPVDPTCPMKRAFFFNVQRLLDQQRPFVLCQRALGERWAESRNRRSAPRAAKNAVRPNKMAKRRDFLTKEPPPGSFCVPYKKTRNEIG